MMSKQDLTKIWPDTKEYPGMAAFIAVLETTALRIGSHRSTCTGSQKRQHNGDIILL